MDQNVMDAAMLEMMERQIKDRPDDEDLVRLYALVRNAINFNSLTPEKQEAVEAELAARFVDEE
jgi:hypothetical protein